MKVKARYIETDCHGDKFIVEKTFNSWDEIGSYTAFFEENTKQSFITKTSDVISILVERN